MKTATLITYDLKSSELSRAQINEFQRRLYGYTDHSNHGRYTYQRKGLLSDIPHLNPSQSVIIVPKHKTGDILAFLYDYDAKVFAIDVVPDERQAEALSKD